MKIAACDFEGVLAPEFWLMVADKIDDDRLRLTTREEPDYDKLMRYRIDLLRKLNVKLEDITKIIADAEPLEGAIDFYKWLSQRYQVVIVSDTFYPFCGGILEKLGYPTMLCHNLSVDDQGFIDRHVLSSINSKRNIVEAFQKLNYEVVAVGDSYNDVTMLQNADQSFFFRPTDKIVKEYPDIPIAKTYKELKEKFEAAANS